MAEVVQFEQVVRYAPEERQEPQAQFDLAQGENPYPAFELAAGVDAGMNRALWVFGYGSLCWKPGFKFDKAIVGHVRDYARKFWQGNATHRGTKDQLGRVATLIDDDKSTVYGVAFALSGESALDYLTNRECTLGGYDTRITTFYPLNGEPIKVLLYIATDMNSLWLGDASDVQIANEIYTSSGESGHNVEYLIRLANFMRHHFPDVDDEHLFGIEQEILRRAGEEGLNLMTLMGTGEECVSFVKLSGFQRVERMLVERRDQDLEEQRDTFQYTARLPEKSLRCLNI